jgi:glycosyltransferase involved in cell wall biosynthesis
VEGEVPVSRPLRVLVVARWYPSHDQPGRGSFVADLVAALLALPERALEVVVASFEATHVRGVAATRPDRGRRAARLMATALAGASARNGPRSWGVPGVPVARLPVFLDGERRRPSDVADAHAAALLPFGEALFGRWPFDVIHAHTGLVDGVCGARLAERVGVPLLVTEHSSTAADELTDPEAVELYRPLATVPGRRVVAVSGSLAHAVAARLELADGALGVLPNAVPIEEFPVGGADARVAAELLYVGSRKASKGIERLLRAFAVARSGRDAGAAAGQPRLRLRLIGSPGTADEEAAWRGLADELGVADAVTVEGPVDRAAVSAAMRRAALFVHPSPRETFGVVAAEALASGLPVVTTPNGGCDEIVGSDGRYGVVARGMEPDDLAAAIGEAIERAFRRAFDPDAMRSHVWAAYAARSVAARTVAQYLELGAGADASRSPHASSAPLPPDAQPAGMDRRPVGVVALARGQAVQRFNLLPAPLRARTTVLTIPPAPSGLNAAPLPPDGRWIELDLRPADVGLPGVTATLRGLVDGNGWLVGLDADDVLAIEPALGAGVDLAPGGLRWVADRWDEAGRAE